MFDRSLKLVRRWLVVAFALLIVSLVCTDPAAAVQPYGYGWDDRPCAPSWMRGPLKWLIPQQVGGADFRPACRVHDACYGAGLWSRRSCDLAFRDNMMAACACSRHPLACRVTAQTMFLTTRVLGGRSYGAP